LIPLYENDPLRIKGNEGKVALEEKVTSLTRHKRYTETPLKKLTGEKKQIGLVYKTWFTHTWRNTKKTKALFLLQRKHGKQRRDDLKTIAPVLGRDSVQNLIARIALGQCRVYYYIHK
jgi:hypothetical protein